MSQTITRTITTTRIYYAQIDGNQVLHRTYDSLMSDEKKAVKEFRKTHPNDTIIEVKKLERRFAMDVEDFIKNSFEF